jgi:hypothetical protein
MDLAFIRTAAGEQLSAMLISFFVCPNEISCLSFSTRSAGHAFVAFVSPNPALFR